MLLARHEINENCFVGKANGIFCVYLNVKRLTMPEKFDQELFNRVFSVFLYNEISKKLINILEQFKEDNLIQRFFDFLIVIKKFLFRICNPQLLN